MDPITAAFVDDQYAAYGIPAGTFGSFNLQTCKPVTRRMKPYPLVLFSPGSGNTRLFHSLQAQQVASAGYIVVTIDHPYDANIVTFPDNTTIVGFDIEDNAFATDVRAQDVSFVLDQLSNASVVKSLIPGLHCGLDTSKVGIFGHSLGGATAAQAMLHDSRLAGGINLEGTFFSTVVNKGLKKPFLIFSHEGKNLTTDESWGKIWPGLKGWKRQFELKGSAHGTFTDFPDLLDVLGFGGGKLGPEVAGLLGTIDGPRAIMIITDYVVTFMKFVLNGDGSGRLDKLIGVYTEVSLKAK